jgi:hypothetical protein
MAARASCAGRAGAGGVWSVAVDSSDVSRWFSEYLDAFAACGRGEKDTALLLDSEQQRNAVVGLSRHRSDGGEIGQLTATYLVTDGAVGRRISVLAVHST